MAIPLSSHHILAREDLWGHRTSWDSTRVTGCVLDLNRGS